jgi:trimeric autotransporter adhesin
VETTNTAQDGRLNAVEAVNTTQDTRLTSVENTNTAQDTRLTAVETVNTTQNSRITSVEAANVTQDTRLSGIDALNMTQNGRLTSLESVVGNAGGRLTALENSVTALNASNELYNRQANGGIAAAMAMGGTIIPADANGAISFNLSTYRGQQGFAGVIVQRLSDKVYANVGISGSTVKKSTGGRVGVTIGW